MNKVGGKKIVTACLAGLVRSVSLADVFKCHYEPIDAIPVGMGSNFVGTIEMLGEWCDWFILMEEHYRDLYLKPGHINIPPEKVLVCEVGPDTYGDRRHPVLINKCIAWVAENETRLGIKRKEK